MGTRLILFFLPFFSFAQYPKQIVYEGDTVIAVTPTQLANLNIQLVTFSKYVTACDSTVALQDSIIENQKLNAIDLKQMVANKELQIQSLEQINKNNKKRSMKRVFLYTGTGVVVGLITGIIIAK